MNKKLIEYERKLASESMMINRICKSGTLNKDDNIRLMNKQNEYFKKYMIIRSINNKGSEFDVVNNKKK